MTPTRFSAALIILTATSACAPASSVATAPAPTAAVSTAIPVSAQVPLLYVVDGVKYPLDEVPNLRQVDISSVRVVKGRAALLKYGPEASYGVVVVTTTRLASR